MAQKWSDERKEAKSKLMTGCTILSGRRSIDKNYVIVSRPELIKAGWFKSIDGLYAKYTGEVAKVHEQDDKFYVKELVPCLNAAGYLQVGGTERVWTVQQVVAYAFLGKCPEGQEIDHIDRNKHNNNIENLRYVTHKENMANRNLERSHSYYGRYNWQKQTFTYPDGNVEKMSYEDYYKYLVDQRGTYIANKIFKAAKERSNII